MRLGPAHRRVPRAPAARGSCLQARPHAGQARVPGRYGGGCLRTCTVRHPNAVGALRRAPVAASVTCLIKENVIINAPVASQHTARRATPTSVVSSAACGGGSRGAGARAVSAETKAVRARARQPLDPAHRRACVCPVPQRQGAAACRQGEHAGQARMPGRPVRVVRGTPGAPAHCATRAPSVLCGPRQGAAQRDPAQPWR